MSMTLVNPFTVVQRNAEDTCVRPESLKGLTVGVLINGKEYSDVVLPQVLSKIEASADIKEVVWWDKEFPAKPAPFLDEIVEKADIVLTGVGH